jgi:hypothetical protein
MSKIIDFAEERDSRLLNFGLSLFADFKQQYPGFSGELTASVKLSASDSEMVRNYCEHLYPQTKQRMMESFGAAERWLEENEKILRKRK